MITHRRVFSYVLLIGAAALLGGCFGSFSLTRTIYRSNRNVYSSVPGDSTQRKMAQSAVMWLFIPVYAVAGVADAVVFNVIEFWTGNRTEISMQEVDGNQVSLAPSPDGRQATLTITRGGRVLSEQQLVKTADGRLEIRDAEGALHGLMVRTPAGSFEFQDAGGAPLQTAALR